MADISFLEADSYADLPPLRKVDKSLTITNIATVAIASGTNSCLTYNYEQGFNKENNSK